MYVRKKHNRSGTTSVVTINFLKLARTITTIKVRMSESENYFTKTLFLTEKHLAIKALFNLSGTDS